MEPINTKNDGDCGYIAMYRGKQIALYAKGMYAAQTKAAEYLKARKSYEVTVVLCESTDGEQVITTIS